MTPGPGADRAARFERLCRPEPGRTALLVVDMQRGFLEPPRARGVTWLAVTETIRHATLDIVRRAPRARRVGEGDTRRRRGLVISTHTEVAT